jgi:restriction system protein
MKLQMAKNSLFALLLRSPWWISAAIALAVALASAALLPDQLRAVGALSSLPFVVIGVMASWRQRHRPSAARIAETHAAVAAMAWPAFAGLLEQSFRRDGYTVQPCNTTSIDFALDRKGRRTLVSARRWKSARTGLEALRTLHEAGAADESPELLYIGVGSLTDTARRFAAEHRITVWHVAELAHALRGLPLGAPNGHRKPRAPRDA